MHVSVARLSYSDAKHLALNGDWHRMLRGTFSEFGFCYELEDIPLAPLLVHSSDLRLIESKLRRLMALSRSLAMSEFDRRSPVRQDHRAIVELYRDADRAPIMGRPDCIVSGGVLKVIELNIESGMGGIQEVHELAVGYNSSPLGEIIDVHLTSPLDAQIQFISTMLDSVASKSVAVVPLADFSRLYLDQSDRLATEIKNRLGVLAKTVFPEALRQGEWLTDGQNDYGIFFRDACYLHEPIALQGMEQALRNARHTNTIVLSDPVDIGVDDKGALALVSEVLDGPLRHHPEFSDLRPIIPWTRLLDRKETTVNGSNVDLAKYVREHRHKLVLKKCASHVGKQVYMGSQTDPAIWEDIVKRTKAASKDGDDWIVQEYLPSDKHPFWFLSPGGQPVLRPAGGTLGPFLYGDTMPGWLVRVQGQYTFDEAVLALPTDGNIGITTIGGIEPGKHSG